MVVRRKRTGFKAEFMGRKGIGRAEIEMKRNCDNYKRAKTTMYSKRVLLLYMKGAQDTSAVHEASLQRLSGKLLQMF